MFKEKRFIKNINPCTGPVNFNSALLKRKKHRFTTSIIQELAAHTGRPGGDGVTELLQLQLNSYKELLYLFIKVPQKVNTYTEVSFSSPVCTILGEAAKVFVVS